MGRRVWFFELRNFLFRDRRLSRGPSLEEFWGTPQDAEERSMQVAAARSTVMPDPIGRSRTALREGRLAPALVPTTAD